MPRNNLRKNRLKMSDSEKYLPPKLFRFFPIDPLIPTESKKPASTTTTTTHIPGSTISHLNETWLTHAPATQPASTPVTYLVTSPWETTAEEIGYSYVMPLVAMSGVILNFLTIFVLTRRSFRSPVFTYLTALAVADVATSAFTLPIGAVR